MTSGIASFIARELAPFPGRGETVVRYMASLILIMLGFFGFEIPMLSMGIIMIFFASRENTMLTALAARSMAVGMTVVLLGNLSFMHLYIEYPLMRMIVLFLLVFTGMFLYRVCRFGSMGYIVAIYSSVSMYNYGATIDPEILTRQELYLWSVSIGAVAVTVLVNLYVLPARPARMAGLEMLRQLAAVVEQIEARIKGADPPPLSLLEVERSIQAVRKHFNAAVTSEALAGAELERRRAFLETVERLYLAAARLARMSVTSVIEDFNPSLHALKAACLALGAAVLRHTDFAPNYAPMFPSTHHQALAAELQEMVEALADLDRAVTRKDDLASSAAFPAQKPSFLTADAFSNPAHIRHAFKAALALELCYLFYNITQWQGIHTCMITCLILALPGLGAVSQKAILRVSGTLFGSAVSLLAAVFIVPHLESVAGFLLLSLAVVGLGGWIGAGSPRSNYAGLQMVYAYSISLCEFYYPSADLLEIRDRLIGIMVGVAVSTLVYSLLWPEKDSDSLPGQLSKLLLAFSGLMRAMGTAVLPKSVPHLVASARAHCWATMGACREMQTRVVLEPGWRYSRVDFTPFSRRMLEMSQKMMLSTGHFQALLAASESESAESIAIGRHILEQSADILQQYAEMLDSGREPEKHLPLPDPDTMEEVCLWAPAGSACRDLPKAARNIVDLLACMNPGRMSGINA